jgi:cytochrome b
MATPLQPVRVWDLPTRVFHWMLAATIVGSVVSAKIGGNAMIWHLRFGAFVGALLLFRVAWGFVGGRWSRFASFLPTPSRLLARVRARREPDIGHGPLGALSVWAMLVFLLAQVATGLIADDEIATTGPLNRYVSSATASLATGWHKNIGQWVVLALIGLHLAAIAFYDLLQRKRLLAAMVSGDKSLPAGTLASTDGPRARALAGVIFGACAALVWAFIGREL